MPRLRANHRQHQSPGWRCDAAVNLAEVSMVITAHLLRRTSVTSVRLSYFSIPVEVTLLCHGGVALRWRNDRSGTTPLRCGRRCPESRGTSVTIRYELYAAAPTVSAGAVVSEWACRYSAATS